MSNSKLNALFCQEVTVKFKDPRHNGVAIRATEIVGAKFLIVDDSGPKYLKIIYASQDEKTGNGLSHKEIRYPHDVIQEIDCGSLLRPVMEEVKQS